jgi:hypothetical protein
MNFSRIELTLIHFDAGKAAPLAACFLLFFPYFVGKNKEF